MLLARAVPILRVLAVVAVVPLAPGARAAELLPLQPGMVVVTQKAASPPWVLRIIDLRDIECSGAPLGDDWTAAPEDTNELPNPTSRPEDQWVLANFDGDELFGIALDDAAEPDIYVTPTISYRGDTNVASGRVWRVDGTTGAISVFAVLPNSGVGLGNVVFDGRNRQFFVSNLEDGRIYRLGLDGAILDAFDPFAADTGAPGIPALGDRAYGLGLWENRVYFGDWTEDLVRRTGVRNSVFSVALDDCGAFVGPERLEITLPVVGGRTFSVPVTDIAFSTTGRMLVAGRSLESDSSTDAHQAQVYEYVHDGTAWARTSNSYSIGGGIDAGGGVDWAECVADATCPGALPHALATGDRLAGNGGNAVHGLQVMPEDGGTPAESYLVHYSPGKRGIGDVEFVRPPACLAIPPECELTAAADVTTAPCEPARVDTSRSIAVHCCGVVQSRLIAPDGLPVGDWAAAQVLSASSEGTWALEIRCDVEPACTDSVTFDVTLTSSTGPQATLETIPGTGCAPDVHVLHVVPDSWGPCSAPEFQWLEDGVPVPGATGTSHEVPASTPSGTHAYSYVVTCPEPLPCGDASDAVDVVVDGRPSGPEIRLEVTAVTTCARDTYLVEVVPGSFGPCSAPEYQWLEDGVPLIGATSSRLFVPETTPAGRHEYVVVVTCPEPLACGDTSAPVEAVIEEPSGQPRMIIEEDIPLDCSRPAITLRVDPTSIGRCSAPAYQWYEDGLPVAGAVGDTHVIPPTTLAGEHFYVFVVTCSEPLPCGNESAPTLVIVRDSPSGPLVRVSVVERNCQRPLTTLEVVPGSFGPCSSPTYQWLENGAPIPGATASGYVVPDAQPDGSADFSVVVGCPEPLPCGDTSAPVAVLTQPRPTGPTLWLEVTPPVGCSRAAYTAHVDRTSFGPCSFAWFEWYVDGVLASDEYDPFLVLDDALAAGPHEVSVLVICVEELGCDVSAPLVVDIEDPPPPPGMDVTITPGDECTRERIELTVTPGSDAGCTAPSYQWWRDGAPVAGATGTSYEAHADETAGPHEYWYVLSCPETLPCGNEPAHEIVDVAPFDSILEGRSLDGLLYVSKVRPSDLALRWSDSTVDATSYSVYAGAIGRWYSHEPLACHVARAGAETSLVTSQPPIDTYYLINPADCRGEGLVGADSFGNVRPLEPVGPACGAEP